MTPATDCLQAAAQRLVKSTRPSDTVARLGGDEFAILLEGINRVGDVEPLAAAITQSFNSPLLLDGSETPHGRQHWRRLLTAR